MKKKEKKQKNENNNKVKLAEKISLKFRKKILIDNTRLFLIILILFMAYIALNLWATQADLPEIDVTENKIYTLSDESKNAVSKINNDIKIYAYGFEENSSLIDLLKQYSKANTKISYEILTEESNYEMVKEYNLASGYYVLIMKSGESEKIVDSSEFTTYDYTTYQSVDTTEQTITNSILALDEKNKPKIYFLQGHGEFDSQKIAVLNSYLINEAFEVEYLNLATTGSIPDDCNILAIMSPSSDIFDIEVAPIKEYINNGGEIYFSMDVVSKELSLPNIQTILDEYGVSIQNGYILEYKANQSLSNTPYIFTPQVSSTHKITQDIYTDSNIWLVYSGKLKFKSDEELNNLKVTKEILLNSSDSSAFATDLTSDLATASKSAEVGASDIAAILTKTVPGKDGEENKDTESKIVVVASASFIADYTVSLLSETTPLSYIQSNKDFVINSMSFLGNKGNWLSIRKDYSSSTYMPTNMQNLIVIAIIILVPLFIIIIGIMIWAYRQRRK